MESKCPVCILLSPSKKCKKCVLSYYFSKENIEDLKAIIQSFGGDTEYVRGTFEELNETGNATGGYLYIHNELKQIKGGLQSYLETEAQSQQLADAFVVMADLRKELEASKRSVAKLTEDLNDFRVFFGSKDKQLSGPKEELADKAIAGKEVAGMEVADKEVAGKEVEEVAGKEAEEVAGKEVADDLTESKVEGRKKLILKKSGPSWRLLTGEEKADYFARQAEYYKRKASGVAKAKDFDDESGKA